MVRDLHCQHWLAALRFTAPVIAVLVVGTALMAIAVCVKVASNLLAFGFFVVVRVLALVLRPTHGS